MHIFHIWTSLIWTKDNNSMHSGECVGKPLVGALHEHDFFYIKAHLRLENLVCIFLLLRPHIVTNRNNNKQLHMIFSDYNNKYNVLIILMYKFKKFWGSRRYLCIYFGNIDLTISFRHRIFLHFGELLLRNLCSRLDIPM